LFGGSTQNIVPVKPVWPNVVPTAKRSPRQEEYPLLLSKPYVRQFFPSGKVPYPPSADCDEEVALIEMALKRYRFRAEQP